MHLFLNPKFGPFVILCCSRSFDAHQSIHTLRMRSTHLWLKAATPMQPRYIRIGPGLSCMFRLYGNFDQGSSARRPLVPKTNGGYMKFWPLDDHLVRKDTSNVSRNAHVLSCPGMSNEDLRPDLAFLQAIPDISAQPRESTYFHSRPYA